jgi:hypothetical protein
MTSNPWAGSRPIARVLRGAREGTGPGGMHMQILCAVSLEKVRNRAKWNSRGLVSQTQSELRFLAHVLVMFIRSITELVPWLWKPHHHPSSQSGDTCVVNGYDRQSWFPHSGCGGAPRDLRGQLHNCASKTDQRAKQKLHSKEETWYQWHACVLPPLIEVRVYLEPGDSST